jgi:hypothetical protein
VASCWWRVAGGGWRVAGGGWRVAGGVSDHSKSNIPNTSSPNAWPVEFLDIDCNRKKTV